MMNFCALDMTMNVVVALHKNAERSELPPAKIINLKRQLSFLYFLDKIKKGNST
jgi:hypothetical protein